MAKKRKYNAFDRIVSGLLYVGLTGAIGLGMMVFVTAISGLADSLSVWERVAYGVLAAVAFVIGAGKSGGEARGD